MDRQEKLERKKDEEHERIVEHFQQKNQIQAEKQLFLSVVNETR